MESICTLLLLQQVIVGAFAVDKGERNATVTNHILRPQMPVNSGATLAFEG
jgi:hypothetical protein